MSCRHSYSSSYNGTAHCTIVCNNPILESTWTSTCGLMINCGVSIQCNLIAIRLKKQIKFSDQNWPIGLSINNPYIFNADIKFLCHKIELQEIKFYYNTICLKVLFIMPSIIWSLPRGHHIWKPYPTKMLGHFPMNLLQAILLVRN